MFKFHKKSSYSVFNILLIVVICNLTILGQDTLSIDSILRDVHLRSIGPAGMSGRVTAIDVDLKNPDRIFIGAASGGIWYSGDGGIDWNPIFDDAETQSIGSIKIDPTNSDVIYAGTGEGNPRNSHSSGRGIYKSIDGGHTWTCKGLENTKLIHRIIVNPQNPNIVYAGTLGSAWGPNEERGLYRSKDGGESWENILYINDSTGIGDVVMDPANPNKLIAATWQFGRTPWTFNSGGPGSGMHVTWDGGDTWKRLSTEDGLPKGELGRMGIAFAPGKPNIVYALIEAKKNGLYKSVDGGKKWKLVSTKNIGNRPFYYAELYVDPSNENRLFNLHTYMSVSEDGGRTFRNVLDYRKGVHPDHHAFWIHPEDPSYMLDGNDGGLAISRDGGRNWRYITNLPLGQFYHVSIDEQTPFNVYGGLQDNGSWYGPSTVYKRGGIRNNDWKEMYFGDGFDVVPVGDGSTHMYAMSQGGNVSILDNETGAYNFIQPVHPEGEPLRFNWNAAIAKDPFDEYGVYFGSQYVHYSDDRGANWRIISPDLTTNDSTKQKQAESGGLTKDATAAENHTTLLCIAPDPFDKDVIWAGSDDGQLHRTVDGGEHWEELSSRLPGFPEGAWIPQIRHSLINQNELFVVVNDYRRNNWSAYTYHSTDNGATWRRIVDDKDVRAHCLSIIQDVKDENLLFLGTEGGLYYSIDKGSNWNLWKRSFPAVPVRDLQISAKEGSLVVGTFGRSIWILDDLTPMRYLTQNENDRFDVLYGQPAYLATIKSADGIRFTADGEYKGTNRRFGLNYYVHIPWSEVDTAESSIKSDTSNAKKSGKKAKNKRSKKVKVVILNSSADTILQREYKYQRGLNAYRWNMRREAVHGPSRKKRKDKDRPARWKVTPGKYEIKVVWNGVVDSVEVEVLADPRDDDDLKQYAIQRTYQDKIDEMTEVVGEATDQLAAYGDELKLVKDLIQNFPDSTKKDWNKRAKSLTNGIDSLYTVLLGEKDVKGIDAVTPILWYEARGCGSYMRDDAFAKNSNLEDCLRHAFKKSNRWIEAVNLFTNEKWIPFKEEFLAQTINPFKETNSIRRIE